jgi:antitoxin component HigA of HigAB toxin-antitoxin module
MINPLLEYKEETGKTFNELAVAWGFSKEYLQEVIAGRKTNLTVKSIDRICSETNIPYHTLITWCIKNLKEQENESSE